MADLETVLVNILSECLEEGEEKISFADAARMNRQIRDYLGVSDSPWGREPVEIADFICHNCGSWSRDAAERWLSSISKQALERLGLVDVLMLLQPMMDEDIEALADENNRANGEGM